MRAPGASLLALLLLAQPAAQAGAAPAKSAAKAQAAGPKVAAERYDAAVIRARRKDYNAAIAARRGAVMATFLTENMAEMTSDAEVNKGRSVVIADYERVEFKDPAFVGYDRQTDTVTIDPGGTVAAERGHWHGQFRAADGRIVGNSGVYQAGWIKQNGIWLIRTEAYMQTTCPTKAGCH